jgi:hypothetical protein
VLPSPESRRHRPPSVGSLRDRLHAKGALGGGEPPAAPPH